MTSRDINQSPASLVSSLESQHAYQNDIIWINEFHYDNAGTDVGEFIEVAYIETLSSLTGYSLVLYNGKTGATYHAIDLDTTTTVVTGSGSFSDASNNGVAFKTFPLLTNVIQNGGPDGIALVDPLETVIEFLSYEGSFTASDGPANGMASVDIGVSESSSTEIGKSLQLVGSGCSSNDFSWYGPVDSSAGTVNLPGQTITGCRSACTTIQDIQGTGGSSNYEGQIVTICGAYITAIVYNGFYIQEEPEESNIKSSSGIFVITTSSTSQIQKGVQVDVTGSVAEFYGWTQISDAAVDPVSGGSTKAFAPIEIELPVSDLSVLERYESMLVSFVPTAGNVISVSDFFDFDRYGSVVVCSADEYHGRIFQYTALYPPNQAGFSEHQDLLGRSCITIDDDSGTQNPNPLMFGGVSSEITTSNTIRGGSQVTTLKGPLFYSFGEYRVQPISVNDLQVKENNPRPVAPSLTNGQFNITSANLLNYFVTLGERGADNPDEFHRQKEKLLTALAALNTDVFGLLELENNDDTALDLRDALNSVLPGREYESTSFLTSDSLGTDAIRCDVFFDTNTFEFLGSAVLDDSKVSEIDPSLLDQSTIGAIFDGANTNRNPIAVTLRHIDTQEKILVVANHFKSKGRRSSSSRPSGADDDNEDGAGYWNLMRTLGAKSLLAWLDTNP